jgi:hypothetical protein
MMNNKVDVFLTTFPVILMVITGHWIIKDKIPDDYLKDLIPTFFRDEIRVN